jgi:GT2 family glycosyltransferase
LAVDAISDQIVGCVERLEGLLLIGWALSSRGTCVITATDGEKILARGSAQKYRSEFSRHNVGFRLPLAALPVAESLLHVYADDYELEGSPLRLGPNAFDGEINLHNGQITGWVAERTPEKRDLTVVINDQYGRLIGQVPSVPRATDHDDFEPREFACELPDFLVGWPEIGIEASCDGRIFAKTTCSFAVDGYLDAIDPGRVAGWVRVPTLPQRKVKLEIYDNTTQEIVGSATCDMDRPDLAAKYPKGGDVLKCGFDCTLTSKRDILADDILSVSMRVAGSDINIFGGPHVIAGNSWAVSALRTASAEVAKQLPGAISLFVRQNMATMLKTLRGATHLTFQTSPTLRLKWEPRCTIIIPAYRNAAVTFDCIESVLAHRDDDRDMVIVINDCSPDIDVAPMLRQYRTAKNVWLVTNPTNLGFVRSVNRGLNMARFGHVILLNSDTIVYNGWIDELVACADNPGIGTATPLSNNATIFSYPHPALPVNELDDIDFAEVAAFALTQPRALVDVPTGHGFCLLIKRDVADEVGLLDETFGRGYGEENDFCQRAADLGYRNVATPTVFVQHRESVSFGDEKGDLLRTNLGIIAARYPEYHRTISQWEKADALRVARWRLDRERLARLANVAVVISNGLPGGTAKASNDIENLVGYDCDHVIRVMADNGRVELSVDKMPLRSIYLSDRDEAELIDTIAASRPQLIVVHQLLGYSARFIESLTALANDIKTVFFGHDFYGLCQRVTMIDAVGRFCNAASAERCRSCISLGEAHETSFINEAPDRHRELFAEFYRACAHRVVPSQDASNYYATVFPEVPFEAIPHPEVHAGAPAFRRDTDPDSVILLGAIGTHKGALVLRDVARNAALDYPSMRFHVIGYTSIDAELKELPNVTLHGRYRTTEELAEKIAITRAGKALFLHIWPETFSYTFSEACAHGLIPIVPDLGAPAERVRALGFGAIFSYPIQIPEVLETISSCRYPMKGSRRANTERRQMDTRSSIRRLAKMLRSG